MIKVVIAEDDRMVASLNAQFAYKTPGVEVVSTFHNGRDALAYLEKNAVDLLLLDLYMPDIDGLELSKALRAKGDPADAIMITAANDAEHIEEALHLGIVDYLVKPFRYERFAAAIQKYIVRREMMDRGDDFTQDDIDRFLSAPFADAEARGAALEKGIQQKTLDMVRECLRHHPQEFLSAEQIAEELRLSRVTARRYLNYLIERHEAVSRINYLTGGHPSTEYKAR